MEFIFTLLLIWFGAFTFVFYYVPVIFLFIMGELKSRKEFYLALLPFGLLIRMMYREFKKLK